MLVTLSFPVQLNECWLGWKRRSLRRRRSVQDCSRIFQAFRYIPLPIVVRVSLSDRYRASFAAVFLVFHPC